jgi:hypothetical protein
MKKSLTTIIITFAFLFSFVYVLRATYVFSDKEDELETLSDNESVPDSAPESEMENDSVEPEELTDENEIEKLDKLSGEEAISIVWNSYMADAQIMRETLLIGSERRLPNLDDVYMRLPSSSQMSYDLVIGVKYGRGEQPLDDTYVEKGQSFYFRKVDDAVEMIRLTRLLKPGLIDSSALPSETIPDYKIYEERYGAISYASFSPDNSLLFLITDRYFILAEVKDNFVLYEEYIKLFFSGSLRNDVGNLIFIIPLSTLNDILSEEYAVK